MNSEKYKPWLSLVGAAGLVRKAVGDDQNSASDELVKAAEAITDAAAKIEKVLPTILSNKMSSSLANAQTARAAIAKITEPVMKRIKVATDYACAGIQALKTQSDPKSPTDVMIAIQHTEVRNALLRMSMPERAKAVATAIASGDETFLAAATSGAPVLSGMSAAEQNAAKERWRTTRHSDVAWRIAHLQNGLAQLERIAPMLQKWSASLIDEPSASTIAAAEQTAAKANAVEL